MVVRKEYTEWQWPLSCVHSIMLEKSSQAVWVGGAHTQPPFIVITITYKVAVYASAERADTLLLFLLYPYIYSVVVRVEMDADSALVCTSSLPVMVFHIINTPYL